MFRNALGQRSSTAVTTAALAFGPVPPDDLGWVKGITDVAVIDFIKKCGGIHKKDSKHSKVFIPGMAPDDLRSYFEEDVKKLIGDTQNADVLYRAVRHQYVAAFLDGVRFS